MDLIVFLIVPFYLLIGSAFWFLGSITKQSVIRQRRRQLSGESPLIAEYSVPPGLRPAEIAYLFDQSIGTPEYIATIFDLESRGFLQLSTGSKPFTIMAKATKQSPKKLLDFETEVYYTALSNETNPGHYGTWTERLWGNQFEFLLERELQNKGLLQPVSTGTWSLSWLNVGIASTLIVWIVLLASYGDGIGSFNELDSFITNILQVSTVIGLVAIALPFIHFGYTTYKKARRLATMTNDLEALWPRIEGYRQYVEAVELERIRFANKNEEEFAMHEALPYAIAFNLDTGWQERFK